MNKNKLVLFSLFTLLSYSQTWAGKIITDSIQSHVLHAVVKYNVYVPRDFEKNKQLYPIVYLLHGLYGTYQDWTKRAYIKEVADELTETQDIVPMVIVMPNAGNPDVHHVWNGYFNMSGWQYETFFFSELMPTVEKKYRTFADKKHRAIMGLSMGGGASTVYCQQHPELFSSCYAMSPWLDDTIRCSTKEEKDKLYLTKKSVHEHSAINFIANANEATKEKLQTIRWFFDCGDDDSFVENTFKVYNLYRKSHIKAELRIRNGSHNWVYWHSALKKALPFASDTFKNIK